VVDSASSTLYTTLALPTFSAQGSTSASALPVLVVPSSGLATFQATPSMTISEISATSEIVTLITGGFTVTTTIPNGPTVTLVENGPAVTTTIPSGPTVTAFSGYDVVVIQGSPSSTFTTFIPASSTSGVAVTSDAVYVTLPFTLNPFTTSNAVFALESSPTGLVTLSFSTDLPSFTIISSGDSIISTSSALIPSVATFVYNPTNSAPSSVLTGPASATATTVPTSSTTVAAYTGDAIVNVFKVDSMLIGFAIIAFVVL